MEVKDLGEFNLIEKIAAHFNGRDQDLLIGIGDDCAVYGKGSKKLSLVTSDMLVEGIHFNLDFTSPYYLGGKSLALNISDIAAMGGKPRWFLLSLALPGHMDVSFVEEFCTGAAHIANKYGLKLIGGDTVASPDKIIISITLMGEEDGTEPIRRDGAADGDQIFVTGTIGDSAAGLELLKGGTSRDSENKSHVEVIMKHLSPTPRILESEFIASGKIATSMIDISDGLLQDLNHICRSSGVRGKVWLDRIPLSDSYRETAQGLDLDTPFPLVGGEDYELLFTVPLEKVEELDLLEKEFFCRVTHIGEIVRGEGVALYDSHNNEIELTQYGYEHFKAGQ
ncbi:MAG: thiamine-phosphate kinase [Deltaproteobacteria bacterium]|nr:thiamine-phosphate kinase [Deltaproteobacteria bacterium]